MIQYIIVITAVAVSAIYILIRLKKNSKGCDSSKCPACSMYSECGKDIKKSRP